MQTTQVYAVERVYDDLRSPFVTKDIIKQLSQLDIVVGDIFNRLAHKVGQEKERVAAIDHRIRTCQAKVNAITARRTSNKPTTVFSTSKYPAPKVLATPKTLFYDKPYADAPVIVTSIRDDTHFLPAEPMAPAQRTQVMTEVLELFETVNPYRKTVRGEVDMSKEGLGRLPEYIPSVGSVLLFNSGENPYQKYTSWDNLLGTDYEEEEEKRKELAQAPKTLVDGDELRAVYGLDYDFKPAPGSVEDLSAKLPTNLPLDNIAEYQYTVENGGNASIAPSMYQDKSLPDLPPVGSFANAPSALEPTNENGVPIGPSDDAPPPPPPAPPVDFSSLDGDEPPPPPPPPMAHDDDNGAPPPPPPPQDEDGPPPPPPTAGMTGDNGEGADDAAPDEPQNPMSSLLAQIRNPNMRLRPVNQGEKKPDVADRAPVQDKPLSIEEEMKLRLARRLAAISGKQDQLEQQRDRARAQKPVEVLTAQEVVAPTSKPQQPPPPPPPPPMDDESEGRRKTLPTIEMSDDEDDQPGRQSDGDSNEDENDFLAQIRNIKKKQDQEGKGNKAKPAPPPPPPKVEEPKAPAIDFSQIRGMRDRAASLSMSEASDWSDE